MTMYYLGTRLSHSAVHTNIHDPVDILHDGHAQCDQVCIVYKYVMRNNNVHSRILKLTHSDGVSGHFVCEVFYEHEFHMFDVHHMYVYWNDKRTKILSNDELRNDQSPLKNTWWTWYGQNGENLAGFFGRNSKYEVWA